MKFQLSSASLLAFAGIATACAAAGDPSAEDHSVLAAPASTSTLAPADLTPNTNCVGPVSTVSAAGSGDTCDAARCTATIDLGFKVNNFKETCERHGGRLADNRTHEGECTRETIDGGLSWVTHTADLACCLPRDVRDPAIIDEEVPFSASLTCADVDPRRPYPVPGWGTSPIGSGEGWDRDTALNEMYKDLYENERLMRQACDGRNGTPHVRFDAAPSCSESPFFGYVCTIAPTMLCCTGQAPAPRPAAAAE